MKSSLLSTNTDVRTVRRINIKTLVLVDIPRESAASVHEVTSNKQITVFIQQRERFNLFERVTHIPNQFFI